MASFQDFFASSAESPGKEDDERNVLVLGGDNEFSKEATFALSDEQWNVTPVRNFRRAIAEDHLGTELDCIIAEYDLHDIDGLTALELVRARYPDIPFILFLSQTQGHIASRAMAAGVTACLTVEHHLEQWEDIAELIEQAAGYYRTRGNFIETRSHAMAILEGVDDPVLIARDESVVHANGAAVSRLGSSRDKITEQHVPSELITVPERSIEAIISGERDLISGKGRLLPPDGGVQQVSLTAAHLPWWTDPAAVIVCRDSVKQPVDDLLTQSIITSPVGMCLSSNLDPSAEPTLATDTAHTQTGDGWLPGISPGSDALSALDRALEEEGQGTFDVETATGDDSRWHRITVNRLEDGTDLDHYSCFRRDITQRKRLERSNRRHEALLDILEDPAFVLDADNRFVLVNAAFLEYFDRDRSDIIGCSLGSLGAQLSALQSHVRSLYVGEESVVTTTIEFSDAGDEIRTAEVTLTKLEQSNSTETVGVVRDVTDYHGATKDLRIFRRAVEAAGHPIYYTDRYGVIEYVNSAFEEVTGYSRDEAVGRTPRLLSSGNHDMETYDDLWETILEGEVWSGDLVNETKDGEEFVVHQTIAPITKDGEIKWFVSVNADITELKRRERELIESTERFENFAETSPYLIFALDESGDFAYLSAKTEEFFGATPEELEGTQFTDLIVEEDREAVELSLSKLLKGESVEDLEVKVSTETVPLHHVEITWTPFEEDGEVRGVHGILRDVNERTERLQQVDVLNRVLRHNLRNDMTVIVGAAELIESRVEEELSEFAEKIIEQSNTLLDTAAKTRRISDILGESPSIEDTDLSKVVREVAEEMREEYPDATIEVDVPVTATAPVSQFFDEALREIVTNAIIHNDRPNPEVEVHLEQDPRSTALHVLDNGPGIPKMEGEILIGASDVKPLAHGKGLGLWIVYWIVRRSGGLINVSEGVQRGSTVTVEIPHRY